MFFVTEDERKVAVLDNAFEADILQQVLQDNEIPALIQSNESLAYGELFQSQRGWGAVFADLQYHEQIRAFLDEIRKGAALPDDFDDNSGDNSDGASEDASDNAERSE
jgi:hypothetical protein